MFFVLGVPLSGQAIRFTSCPLLSFTHDGNITENVLNTYLEDFLSPLFISVVCCIYNGCALM
ncbi:MAG TPA: hypothetical protein PKN57_10675 [Saprospiraceae bacterium]|nr:hypothetical protein [Saprospiraceae bacterium]HNA40770.1 hypothetical protein [Saprospiraceae bacterium]HND16889.1 hypothetical protein [Saprospiraceae bacterium]HNG05365.1 hypothetical protein [Saprospiraceae bacterium]HNL29720.1 hypothetical protein [Saprospiraceae bacterium]